MEHLPQCAVPDVDRQVLRPPLRASGPVDDDPASGRVETQSEPDADRRCRPACQVVFRAEAGAAGVAGDGRSHAVSDERAGDVALEKLSGMAVVLAMVARCFMLSGG